MISQSQSQATSLKPFLNHAGKTTIEQIEKNQKAIELLKDWLSEEVPATELAARKSYLAELKQTILQGRGYANDSQRLPGSKLYSAE